MEIPKDRPLNVKATQWTKELLTLNDEITGFLQQRHKHQMALKEVRRVLKDVKNKKIKNVLMPSIGGVLIRVDSNNPDLKKLYEDKERLFDNAIKGIEGQIRHRLDNYNETLIKLCRYSVTYLDANKFKIPTPHDRIKEKEEEKKEE